jgi:hypothetical protein
MAKKKCADPKKTLRQAQAKRNKDKHELVFLDKWRERWPHLPEPTRDFTFPKRKPGPRSKHWKLDWGWGDPLFCAVELHGGGGRGRHLRLTGHDTDCRKLNDCNWAGIRCFQYNVIGMKNMDDVVEEVGNFISLVYLGVLGMKTGEGM